MFKDNNILFSYNFCMQNRGFTLAEVLITLGIIGVVAALVLPGAITKYQKKITEVQLKKDYVTLASALHSAEAEYGPVELWFDRVNGTNRFFERFSPYINFAFKPCSTDGVAGACWRTRPSSYYNGVLFRLKDGSCGLFNCTAGDMFNDPARHCKFYLSTTCKNPAIKGKNLFYISMVNLKDLNRYVPLYGGNVSDNIYIYGKQYYKYSSYVKSYGIKCDPDKSWGDYRCFMKYAHDGFQFKDDYHWEDQKYIDNIIDSMIKAKPKGWF